MPWTIGWRALKKTPELNSSSPRRPSDGSASPSPPETLHPKIRTRTE
jgi:hypothetical protein